MVYFSTNYNESFVGESGPMIVKELSVKSSSLLTRMFLVNHNQKQKKSVDLLSMTTQYSGLFYQF